jgi:hypothetical protein
MSVRSDQDERDIQTSAKLCAEACRFSETRLLSVAEYVQALGVIRKWDKEKCDKIGLRALQTLAEGE